MRDVDTTESFEEARMWLLLEKHLTPAQLNLIPQLSAHAVHGKRRQLLGIWITCPAAPGISVYSRSPVMRTPSLSGPPPRWSWTVL